MLRFGTDGVRGDADTQFSTAFVVALGRAAASVLGTEYPFLIGTDTRASGPRIAHDLAVGLRSAGAAVEMLGVLTTPGIAFASQSRLAPAAVISASHNPWSDNGIKFFAPGGLKLNDAAQSEIERHLENASDEQGASLGAHTFDHDPGIIDDTAFARRYQEHLWASLEGRRLDGLRVVIDAANGAASALAMPVFGEAGATVSVIHAMPDGTNINANCGSTHMGSLRDAVLAANAHVGFALDGDADRCLAVDEFGNVIDGDELMVALAIDMKQRGALDGNSLVVTVLSNLGLHIAMRSAGIAVVETPVGDRSVMAALESGGFALGGEQSGHIIVRHRATTGDGLLTALLFSDLLRRRAMSASAAKAQMVALPQVMVNVVVSAIPDLPAAAELWSAVAAAESTLGDSGRVLVRASGTEPLIRVMVEAPTEVDARECAERLAHIVRTMWA